MKNKNVITMSLAILVNLAIVTGCATQDMPNSVTNNNSSVNNNNSSNNANTTANMYSTSDVRLSVIAYNDDEATFADSEVIANRSFTTKAETNTQSNTSIGASVGNLLDTTVGVVVGTNGSTNTNTSTGSNSGTGNTTTTNNGTNTNSNNSTNTNTGANTSVNTTTTSNNGGLLGNINANVNLNLFDNLKTSLRADLVSSGVVSTNVDGSLVLDQNKYNQERETVRNKLQVNLQALTDSSLNLRRNSNSIINSSNIDVKANTDGSTTRTAEIQFKSNSNVNINRNNLLSSTSNNAGKNISREHSLKVTTDLYVRTVNRIVLFDINSNTRKVITNSTTTFNDGSSRVMNEERTLDANGSGTGTGSLVINSNNGNSTTYNLNSSIKADVAVSGSFNSSDAKNSAGFVANANGSFTQTSTTNGQNNGSQEYNLNNADSIAINVQSKVNSTSSSNNL